MRQDHEGRGRRTHLTNGSNGLVAEIFGSPAGVGPIGLFALALALAGCGGGGSAAGTGGSGGPSGSAGAGGRGTGGASGGHGGSGSGGTAGEAEIGGSSGSHGGASGAAGHPNAGTRGGGGGGTAGAGAAGEGGKGGAGGSGDAMGGTAGMAGAAGGTAGAADGTAGAAGGTAGAAGSAVVSARAVAVTVGYEYACALTTIGGVECWGWNGGGQLGNGSDVESSVPVQVQGLTSGVVAISAGGTQSAGGYDAYNSTCAITTGGGVMCWGSNLHGKLGNGNTTTTSSSVPVQVAGLTSGITGISVGNFSSCAVTAGGGVVCWGSNSYGELGNDSTVDSPVPVQVSGLTSGVTSVSVGGRSACAVKADGEVLCWGNNTYLLLGNGSRSASSTLVPMPVVGLAGVVTSVSVGMESVCVILTGGAVQCWGDGLHGALGIGPVTALTDSSPVPVSLDSLPSGVTALAVGDFSACAVLDDGGLQCWGSGNNGQLGNNSTMDGVSPAQVMGLSMDVTAVATSASFTCAVTAMGWVECWGLNSAGQLGSKVPSRSLSPVAVIGFP